MAINFQHLAIALGGRIAFEQMCRREALLDESMVKRTTAEILQAMTQLEIEAEYNHADLPGDTRLDLIGRTRADVPLSLAAELKWVKAEGGTRQWVAEVAEDALRLERLEAETTSLATERALIICGINQTIRAQVLCRQGNVGGGRIDLLPHVLHAFDPDDELPSNQVRVPVRECHEGMRDFWRRIAAPFGDRLPVSYQAALAAHHQVDPRPESIRVFVWLIRRSRNRSDFSLKEYWQ